MPNSDSDDKTRSYVQLAHGSIIGHYRIIEKIGAGGMGEVYLAEDTELNRKVALKFLPLHLCHDPECRTRFTREAQAAAQLDHPNIVSVFEVGEFQGRPFFSMQLVELTRNSRHVLILLEKEQQTARTVAEDAGRLLNCPPLEIKITDDIHTALTDILESPHSSEVPESFVLVSPHEWSSIDQRWRDHPNVQLVPFRIREEAWGLIADGVGMPMGALG